MASYTTNLNLKKPAGSENVAIGDINNNMDTIDQAYGTLNSNINSLIPQKIIRATDATTSITLNIPNSARIMIDFLSNSVNADFSINMLSSTTGTIAIQEKAKGSEVTFDTSVTNKLTINLSNSRAGYFIITTAIRSDLDNITLAT